MFPLKPLTLPTEIGDDPVVAAASPAVRLFCERAAVARRGFRLTARNAGVVSELCHELEGVPLAIELAAARVGTMSPRAVLTRFRKVLTPPSNEKMSTAAVDGSAELTVLGWSIELLTPRQRVLLGLCAVFAGSFDWAALTAVVGPSISAQYSRATDREMAYDLEVLVTAGLVSARVPGGNRLGDALLGGALDPPNGGRVVGGRRIAGGSAPASYRVLPAEARRIAEHQWAFGGTALARRLVADQSEFLAALAEVVASGDAVAALCFAVDLTELWVGAATQATGLRTLSSLVSRAENQTGGPLSPDLEAGTIVGVSTLAMWIAGADTGPATLGRLAKAEEMALGAGLVDLAWQARHLRIQLLVIGGSYNEALEEIGAALVSESLAPEPYWRMRLLLWWSMALNMAGDREAALEAGVQARDLAQLAGDEHQLLLTSHVLSGIPGARADPRASVPEPEELLDRARRLGDPYAEGHIVSGVILNQLVQRNVVGAAQRVLEALDLARRTEAWYLEELAVLELVMVASLGGRPQWAASLHGSLDTVLPAIAPRIPGAALKEYTILVRTVEEALGHAQFQRACAATAGRSWNETLEDARRVATRLASDPSRPRQAGEDKGSNSSGPPSSPSAIALPPRELEVLRLLASGCSNKEIAALLVLSPKTVMHYTTRIYRRLGVRSRAEAVSAGWRRGLLPPG